MVFIQDSAEYEEMVEEHKKMIEYLEIHDKKRLKELLADHIQTFRERSILFMVS
ncbi:hypothetical protein [Desulfobacula sp.]